MSHHLDTPLAAQGGQLYIDDLFVFNGDRATVFVMDVNSSVTKADIKRGFHAEGRYEFKIHVNGTEMEDLTYRFAFGELDGDGKQAFQLYELTGSDARDDAAMGTPIAEGRTGEMSTGTNVRIWAGRITDPFFVDLDELATINGAVKDGSTVDVRRGASTRPRTASPARPSSRSSWRSPTTSRCCATAPRSACGVGPSWPPTPEDGARSTAPATP